MKSSSVNNTKKNENKKLKLLGSIKNLNEYDFIDLGAGDGASLVNYEKKIGGKGLGVDLDKVKVKKAAELGRNVVYGDALNLHKLSGKVDFVTCDNFLEHLLSFDEVEKMLEQAIKKSRKFIYIRHPSFEDIDYLSSLGLKTYWTDWRGHTSMLKIADIVSMLLKHGIQTFKIVPIYLVKNSKDTRVIPLNAPIDQHHYIHAHGPKPSPIKKFDREVYYAFDIIGIIPGAEKHMPQLIYIDRLKHDGRPKFTLKSDETKTMQTHEPINRSYKSIKKLSFILKRRS